MSNLLKKKSVTQLLEHNQSKTLTKTLGAFDLIMLGVGSIVGTGVLVLTGLVATEMLAQQLFFIYTCGNYMWIYSIMLRGNCFYTPGVW